jgi:amino acid adenylation domain-containing protein
VSTRERLADLSPERLALLQQRLRERAGGRAAPQKIRPREADGPLPLSFAQSRLWFLDQLEPGSPAYNVPAAVRVRGGLDVAALGRALNALVARHESLRTTFAAYGGEPVQVIHPPAPVPLPLADLSRLEAADRETELLRLAAQEARRPFDLAAGPLLRCRILRLGAEDHGVLFTQHHVVSDGWSTDVLEREVSALYEAAVRGEDAHLPPLPVQYADYAVWQRGWLSGGVLEAQAAWWRERLAGAPPLLEIPTDRPRTAAPAPSAVECPVAVPAEAAGALRALARREEATLFMAVLAAWQALLARWSGQEDVVVGTPVSGRTRVETEGLIGFFVNTLALRGDLSGDPCLRVLLSRAREEVLAAHAHQDLPFERLVDALGVERSLTHTPVFQAVLTLQAAGREPGLRLGGARLEDLGVGNGVQRFDLALDLAEDGEALAGGISCRADRFDPVTARRLAGHFVRLVEAWAADPDLPLSAVELMDAGERRQVLAAARGEARPYPFVPVHRQVEAQAARTPDAVAVAAPGTRLTYAALERRAGALARALRARGARGAGPGAVIPFVLERGAGVPVAMLAILKTGAAFAPVDPRWPDERIRGVLDELASPVVVADAGAATRDWAAGRVLLPPDGEGDGEPEPGYDAAPGDPLYVIYTSGSTGRPKGVVVPHRGIANRFAWMTEWFGADAARSVLQTTRHVYDSAVWQLLWPLAQGGRTVVPADGAETDAAALAALVAAEGVTLTDFVPSVLGALLPGLEADPAARARLASLRAVVLGGEAISAEAAYRFMEIFPSVRVTNLYGPTEASIGCVAYRVTGGEGGRIPIGRPIANAVALVLDARRRPVPVGVPGELYLSGACLGRGYLGQPARTAEAFVENPFPEAGGPRMYRTGDRARQRADGNLEFLGRVDEQVKIRGFRVEPGEVESALLGHPAVREAAVVARPAPAGGLRLLGYAVLHAAAEASPAALRAYLRERLPAAMVPEWVSRLDAFPLTPGGKLDRRALPDPAGPDGGGEGFVPPRDALEGALARVWEELLGRPVGVRDPFFDVGGHSLLAVRLLARVEAVFGRRLPVSAVFAAPTVEEMAVLLRREGARPPAEVLVPFRPGADGEPLFLVHGAGGTVFGYGELARALGPGHALHAFQGRGAAPGEAPHGTVEEMADAYLRALREARPARPWRLGGWSMGGAVAWEMAVRLEAEGDPPDALLLLDAHLAAGEEEDPDGAEELWIARLAGFVRQLGIPLERLPLTVESLLPLPAGARLEEVLRAAGAAGVLPPGVEPEEAARLYAVYAAHGEALRRYRPAPYGGRVLLLRAEEGDDPAPAWRPLARGGLEVRDVPGDHFGMLREHVQPLAGAIQAFLSTRSAHR